MNIAVETRALPSSNSSSATPALTLHSLFETQPGEYLATGKALFQEEDDASHVFQVFDGVLRVFTMLPDGRRVITGFLYPGDFLGLSLGRRYLHTAEAVCASTVKRLSRWHLDRAVEDSARLRSAVFASVSDEAAAAQSKMIMLASQDAEGRLCSFLLGCFSRDFGAGEERPTIELPMCRQDIADYLGLSIETVSRTMTRLISKHVLRIEDAFARNIITIDRPDILAHICGDAADSGNVDLMPLQHSNAGLPVANAH